MASRVVRALVVLYVIATAIHIGLVVAHEPFAFDAWNVARDTEARPFSGQNFYDYLSSQYLHSNPRLGQWFAYLAYKLEEFAVIATPLAYLALALAVTVLGLGRWPSRRSGRDFALFALALGSLWFALPRIGMLLFCRAYATNYVYTAALQLWFLVPLRLGWWPFERAKPWVTIPYFVFGVLAGMCNEHTGPTLALAVLGYAVWRQRSTGRRPNLAWAGALGVVVGFAVIFFAPGQRTGRYDGLMEQVGLVERLLQRAVTGNLDIYRDFVIGAAPVLGLIAIALVLSRADAPEGELATRRRDALRMLGLALLAGSLITATVFVSPKLGARFYLHSCALVLAAFVAIADATLTTPRRLAPFVALAVAASISAGVRTIPLYLRRHDASVERLASLEATPRGAVFTAASFDQVEDSWWFLGDDFRDIKKRELIKDYFDLGGVIFRAVDIEAPLGVSDVRLVARGALSPDGAGTIDDHGGLQLGSFRGIDLKATHVAVRAALEDLRRRIHAGHARLDQLELSVAFVGSAPELPRKRLVVARWTPEGYEGWAGVIRRGGVGKTRSVKLPPELAAQDFEIFIYQVGSEARRLGTTRDRALEYVPWARGAYWALACRPGADECFVIAATRLR
ncbi:MAG: DUF6056 family protein [Kofleriaceae bacterium]